VLESQAKSHVVPRAGRECSSSEKAESNLEGAQRSKAPVTSIIIRDEYILGSEPIIKGTRTPVRAVAEIWRMGTMPEEIPQHLPHLTLA
jgi:uncharacterized protein (DUF433 family)